MTLKKTEDYSLFAQRRHLNINFGFDQDSYFMYSGLAL
jgi:hypothetical protein